MQTFPLISVENLSYTRPQWAMRDLSFTINRGECMAFMGKNGTGKTTTLNLIAGLIKPHTGRILIQGFNIHTVPVLAKQFIGFLSDQCPLYCELTVNEYLSFIAKLRQISKSDIPDHVAEALEQLNLKQEQHRLIGLLSKGTQQRVGLASAILHRPSVLLLDEPTQGLDQSQIEDFQLLLSQYKKNAAIILSTHYLNEVESICDHALQFSTETIKIYDINHCAT